ncbi:MAG: hypothetical protein ACT4P1_17025 [Sporichthyaceae bacterium]
MTLTPHRNHSPRNQRSAPRAATVLGVAAFALLPTLPAAQAATVAGAAPHGGHGVPVTDTDPLRLSGPGVAFTGIVTWTTEGSSSSIRGGVQANLSIAPGTCARIVWTWRTAAGAVLNTDRLFRCNDGARQVMVRVSPALAAHADPRLRAVRASLFTGPVGGVSSQADSATAEFLRG